MGTEELVPSHLSSPPLHSDQCSQWWPWTTGGLPRVGAQLVKGDGPFLVHRAK